MDYQKHYNLLIESRKKLNREKTSKTYYESHHIIPRSMKGSNSENNLVLLTPREHFIAHWLLFNIHKNRSMAYAFWLMCCFNEKKGWTRTSSKTYNIIKTELHEHMSGWKHSEESLVKMKNKRHSQESKDKIGQANKKSKPKSYGENLSKLMKEGLAEKIGSSNRGISRNKGRQITWKVGHGITTIYQLKDEEIINTWVGINELKKYYSLSRVYNSIKNNKKYKGFIWKKKL